MDKLVEAALELDRVSIGHVVEMQPAQAREFLSQAEAYNAFTQEDLVGLVDAVDALVPPMRFDDPSNPNTGRQAHTYLLGNEASRVVYVQVPKFYLDERFQGKPFDYLLLAGSLEAVGLRAGADEICMVQDDDTTFKFRFWWD